MESGAALRAKAISVFRSGIMYSLSLAMLEYGVLDCACICELAPSATASTELVNPIILDVVRIIYSPFRANRGTILLANSIHFITRTKTDAWNKPRCLNQKTNFNANCPTRAGMGWVRIPPVFQVASVVEVG